MPIQALRRCSRLDSLENFFSLPLGEIVPSIRAMCCKPLKEQVRLLEEAIQNESMSSKDSQRAAFEQSLIKGTPISYEDPRSGNRHALYRPAWQIFSTYLDGDGGHEVLLEGHNYTNQFKLKHFDSTGRIRLYQGRSGDIKFEILYEEGSIIRIDFEIYSVDNPSKSLIWTPCEWKVSSSGRERPLNASDIPDLKHAQEVVTWQAEYLNKDGKKAVA